uniref:WRKY domain-containing protein n=1 Tax=Leersia perrieri TaxID=77586 RepID=A0A0D9WXL5_9ORYZ
MQSLLVKTMIDDGWNWRKSSQKDILGSKYQRSYFRCSQMHSEGCKARKIVESNNDDLNIWLVTYINEHSHQKGAGPCDEQSPSDLHVQLATTRKRKEFDASNDEITSKKQFSEEQT